MARLFGTDGVRGVANQDLTPELAFALGRVGTYVLAEATNRPQFVVGRDTRLSGDMLEAALTAGILSAGGDVLSAGVIPTPAVAYLTRVVNAKAGIMISASHNPAQDNGIKFFTAEGYKLPAEIEAEIEKKLAEDNFPRPTGAGVGKKCQLEQASGLYLDHLEWKLAADLSSLAVVIDAGHGAAYKVAAEIIKRLGAQVRVINAAPTGTNINAGCGSIYPQPLQQLVKEIKADLGLAFDGDADRVVAVDEKGQLVDGDQIMAVLALWYKDKRMLKGNGLVATPMSNMGLKVALAKNGIQLVQAPVGDRHVLEELLRRGWNLGGEQSGHIINLDYNSTGDGLSTALQLLRILAETKRPLSQLAATVKPFPSYC